MIPRSPHITAILLVSVGLTACLGEADHSNPLDPRADEFEEVGRIEGTTTRYYPPFAVVESAEVRLRPGPFLASSDAEGRFVFDGVPVGDYVLEAFKNGFASFERSVSVELGKTTDDLRVRMDGVPSLRVVSFRSIHISRWFPPDDLYLLEAVVLAEDADGLSDLDRIWFEIPTRNFAFALSETAVAGRYEAAVTADSLPGGSLFALQGAEMRVFADDDAGFQAESGPHFLVRVIEYTPVALQPRGQENVGSATPTLVWEDAALPYDYTYRLDVVRDQANVQTVVKTIENIPQDDSSYTLETPLAPGTYFWTVAVVDEHGNRSRSKEAGFIVPE